MSDRPVYLDCNATTPVDPEVASAIVEYTVTEFGNAGSRTHLFGSTAKQAVERARELVASVVAAAPDEVIFTSGATESNNLSILGLAAHGEAIGRRHVVTSAIEHKAVLEPIQELKRRGFSTTCIAPTRGGWIDPADVRAAIQPDTLLVSIMHVNNETGVIQPIREIANEIGDFEAYFHVDAAQGYGKRLEDLVDKRIDLISISGHKIYGPKGIGALVARRRGFQKVPLRPLLFGGGQERGLRPGTQPVPLIAGLGRAAELASKHNDERSAHAARFRKQLLDALGRLEFDVNGEAEKILPTTINISIRGVDSEALMVALKDRIAISNGSACTSQSYAPSHVLVAMGLPDERIKNAVRISWCHLTPDVDWDTVVPAIERLVH